MTTPNSLLDVISRHWGFSSLRPMQEAAIQAVVEHRDSLLVLPTGGGKSLCYQAPAVLKQTTTVVISPLIALMKDQVDSLRSNGIPAVQLNSALPQAEIREAEQAILRNEVRLVFASPERMATAGFRALLRQMDVRTFAIDEAHCISHWGHDFRPEYRQLNQLKELFPQASVHAFTATATEQVRADIIEQLGLRAPEVLVGDFDRPNLTYSILPRQSLPVQVMECVQRHKGEAGIIYCIRKKDVDAIAGMLQKSGISALPYHAGLDPQTRKSAQDAFIQESCDVIVATVAFGMGIDRSNIRYVLHTGLPKSIEHYQQETGRAGRDGLEAECVLLFSMADVMTWRSIMEKSVDEAPVDPEFTRAALRHLSDMERYCRPVVCRHKALVEYFGQQYPHENCGACDLCLGMAEPVPEGNLIAKKILSCVFRVQERFGMNHVIDVLRGSDTANVRQWGHENLTTYGLLKEHAKTELRDWMLQLLSFEALRQSSNDRPVLKLTPFGWEIMKDQKTVTLLKTPGADTGTARPARMDTSSWEGVDRPLFDVLKELRKTLATERGVPPYIVFSDATLRDLARFRPSTPERMHTLYGVGEAKLKDFGRAFLDAIAAHCGAHGLAQDVIDKRPPITPPAAPAKISGNSVQAMNLFRSGANLAEVMRQTGRARSTTVQYLCDWITVDRPTSISRWVSEATYERIAPVAKEQGLTHLKPIFSALNEEVPYDAIRIVVTHLALQSPPAATN